MYAQSYNINVQSYNINAQSYNINVQSYNINVQLGVVAKLFSANSRI